MTEPTRAIIITKPVSSLTGGTPSAIEDSNGCDKEKLNKIDAVINNSESTTDDTTAQQSNSDKALTDKEVKLFFSRN